MGWLNLRLFLCCLRCICWGISFPNAHLFLVSYQLVAPYSVFVFLHEIDIFFQCIFMASPSELEEMRCWRFHSYIDWVGRVIQSCHIDLEISSSNNITNCIKISGTPHNAGFRVELRFHHGITAILRAILTWCSIRQVHKSTRVHKFTRTIPTFISAITCVQKELEKITEKNKQTNKQTIKKARGIGTGAAKSEVQPPPLAPNKMIRCTGV